MELTAQIGVLRCNVEFWLLVELEPLRLELEAPMCNESHVAHSFSAFFPGSGFILLKSFAAG